MQCTRTVCPWLLFAGSLFTAPASHAHAQCAPVWVPSPPGFDNTIMALVAPRSGGVVAAGDFLHAPGTPALVNYVAQSNGSTWSPMGTGFASQRRYVVETSDGTIVAGGTSLLTMPTQPLAEIARWDGSNWVPLGSWTRWLDVLVALPGGRLIAALRTYPFSGTYWTIYVVEWNGFAWSYLASLYGQGHHFKALAMAPTGDLIAGGDNLAGWQGGPMSYVARWSNGTWSPLGGGVNGRVWALTVLANGDIVAGGEFTVAGGAPAAGIARWNGTAWASFGTGLVGAPGIAKAIVELPNGDLVAGGQFLSAGGLPASNLARWDGSTWSPLGAGVSGPVSALALARDGTLSVGGLFATAGGLTSPRFAQLVPPCPASAAGAGAGCTGPAGPVVTTIEALPWLDGTFRASTTGVAPLTLALGVFGITAIAVPLASLLPQGVAGCMLHVSPDLLVTVVPAAGAVTTSLPIPATTSLIGQSFRHQVVPIEFDAAGHITAITSGDAFVLTIGTL